MAMGIDKLIGSRCSYEGAHFSESRTHRYTLWRRWWMSVSPTELVAFVGLNPSTADEKKNAPTVRRCIDYAKRWGYGGMVMLNAFAYRSTDPAGLKICEDPIGPENDRVLQRVFWAVGRVVLCYGNHATLLDRHRRILQMAKQYEPHAFKLTKGGLPSHPLYLPMKLEARPLAELQEESKTRSKP